MKNKLTLLSNWIIYIVICLIMYFWENVAILDFSNPIRGFTTNEIIVFFLGIILLTTVFFVIEKKRNNFKFNWFLIIILSILFISSSMVAIFSPEFREFDVYSRGFLTGEYPIETTFHGVYYLSVHERVFSVFFSFLNCLMIYLFLGVLPKKIRFQKMINYGIYIGLIFTLVVMVYSYVTEWNKYIEFIVTFFDKGFPYHNIVQSFFANRNGYGILMYFAIFGCLYIHHNHPKWWWMYPIAWFLFGNLIFSLAKASIGLSFVLLIGYPIGRFFITFKNHKKRNLLSLIIILASVVIIGAIISNIFIFNDHLREVTVKSLRWIFISEDQHVSTLRTRIWIWENSVDILNKSSWIFGAGFYIFEQLTFAYNVTDISTGRNKIGYAHNYFVQIIGEGGLIYLAFILFVMVMYIIVLVKLAKRHKSFVLLQGLFFGTFFVHMMLGSSGPIAHSLPSLDGVLCTALCYIPTFATYYHEKRPEDNEAFLKEANHRIKTRKKYFNNPYSLSDIIYMVFTPILGILLGPVWMALKNNVLGFVIAGIVFFFIGPYLIQLIYNSFKDKTKKYNNLWKYLLNVELPFLVGLVVMFTFNRIFFVLTEVTFATGIFGGFVSLLLYTLLFMFIPKFAERAELITTFDHNFTNIVMRIYRPYVKENVDKEKRGEIYG